MLNYAITQVDMKPNILHDAHRMQLDKTLEETEALIDKTLEKITSLQENTAEEESVLLYLMKKKHMLQEALWLPTN